MGVMTRRGFFSLIRYRSDAARDEHRNIAIALVDEAGGFAAIKSAPISSLSPQLRAQGLVDAMLVGLARDLGARTRLDGFGRLDELSGLSSSVLLVGAPQSAAITANPGATLDSLYRALVAPKVARGPGIARSQVLDQVIRTFRSGGTPVERGAYLSDFILDAVASPTGQPQLPIHTLSYALPNRDWSHVERDTGHFLFAIDHLKRKGVCVMQPPSSVSPPSALESLGRVTRWLVSEGVETIAPDQLQGLVGRYAPEEQLPLVMA
jgi:hypothetical protein